MKKLLDKIQSVERLAKASRIERLLSNPFRYSQAILHRKLIYSTSKKEKPVICKTFFDVEMHLLLPSSTDIYLTGGKTHDSEIRLAKFLIGNLKKGHTFVDVGAHYGYFSLLASTLVGQDGTVYAFEAAPKTYRILEKNKLKAANVSCYNMAVANYEQAITFYEFPNLYAEYNALDIEQYREESWFEANQPKATKIESIRLSDFFAAKNIQPDIIKIDVEGAEYLVLQGLKSYLADKKPVIAMEYLPAHKGNKAHRDAENLLRTLGYQAMLIDDGAELMAIDSVSSYLDENGLDSENIVFKI